MHNQQTPGTASPAEICSVRATQRRVLTCNHNVVTLLA